MYKKFFAVIFCVSILAGAGCTNMNRTQQGALSGTALGAAAGAGIAAISGGAAGWGALTGAGIGALAGGIIGHNQGSSGW